MRSRGAGAVYWIGRLLQVTGLLVTLVAATAFFGTPSTLKEVMPIASVDGAAIGKGKPGPVTRKLLDAYRAYARKR